MTDQTDSATDEASDLSVDWTEATREQKRDVLADLGELRLKVRRLAARLVKNKGGAPTREASPKPAMLRAASLPTRWARSASRPRARGVGKHGSTHPRHHLACVVRFRSTQSSSRRLRDGFPDLLPPTDCGGTIERPAASSPIVTLVLRGMPVSSSAPASASLAYEAQEAPA